MRAFKRDMAKVNMMGINRTCHHPECRYNLKDVEK
jgi:hypothetical protein